MSVSPDLHAQFDELSAQIEPAQRKCNETYNAWAAACAEWKDLSRRRNDVWLKMMDQIATPSSGSEG